MNPTDPMTPVRALLDAHAARSAAIRAGQPFAITEALRDKCFVAASFAVPALTALLSEHDKVVAYIAELRAEAKFIKPESGWSIYKGCADKLATILERK